MAKKNIEARILTFGIHTAFDSESKELPKILEFTTKIPARLGIEFGYVLNVRKGRGEKLRFRIEHPPFRNSSGDIAPPFEGEVYVTAPDFKFFLGDTIWEPTADKLGRMDTDDVLGK